MSSRLCRACQAGTCADCANYGHPTPWCEHLCSDGPRQLVLNLGEKMVARRPGPQSRAGGPPPDDEEVPF